MRRGVRRWPARRPARYPAVMVSAERLEDYDDDGVDRSLIRWFFSLTPEERLSSIDDAAERAELVARGQGVDPAR